MLPNGVCITFLLLFMIVWNEIKNMNLPDIADDNQLKKTIFCCKNYCFTVNQEYLSRLIYSNLIHK